MFLTFLDATKLDSKQGLSFLLYALRRLNNCFFDHSSEDLSNASQHRDATSQRNVVHGGVSQQSLDGASAQVVVRATPLQDTVHSLRSISFFDLPWELRARIFSWLAESRNRSPTPYKTAQYGDPRRPTTWQGQQVLPRKWPGHVAEAYRHEFQRLRGLSRAMARDIDDLTPEYIPLRIDLPLDPGRCHSLEKVIRDDTEHKEWSWVEPRLRFPQSTSSDEIAQFRYHYVREMCSLVRYWHQHCTNTKFVLYLDDFTNAADIYNDNTFLEWLCDFLRNLDVSARNRFIVHMTYKLEQTALDSRADRVGLFLPKSVIGHVQTLKNSECFRGRAIVLPGYRKTFSDMVF
jgi:hypothetical protein